MLLHKELCNNLHDSPLHHYAQFGIMPTNSVYSWMEYLSDGKSAGSGRRGLAY